MLLRRDAWLRQLQSARDGPAQGVFEVFDAFELREIVASSKTQGCRDSGQGTVPKFGLLVGRIVQSPHGRRLTEADVGDFHRARTPFAGNFSFITHLFADERARQR